MMNYKNLKLIVLLAILSIYYYLLTILISPDLIAISSFVLGFGILLIGINKLISKVNVKQNYLLKSVGKLIKTIKVNHKKDPWMVSLGFTLIIVVLIEYIKPSSVRLVESGWYLWLSNLLPLFLSYALIFRNRLYITAVFLTTFLFEVPWNIDFYSRVFIDKTFFGGRADYMLGLYRFDKLHFFSNLNHLWFLPVSFYGVVKLGLHKRAYLLVGFWSVIINSITWMFIPSEENINCVRKFCDLGPTVNRFTNKIMPILKSESIIYLLFWTIVPPFIIIFPLNILLYNLSCWIEKDYSRYRKKINEK